MAFIIDGVGSESGNTADLENAQWVDAFLEALSSTWGTFPDPGGEITHPLSGAESDVSIRFVENTGIPNQDTTFNCSVPSRTPDSYDPPTGPFTGSMSGKTFIVGMNAGWFEDDPEPYNGNEGFESIIVDMKILEGYDNVEGETFIFIGIPEGRIPSYVGDDSEKQYPWHLFVEFKEVEFTHETPGTNGNNKATETWEGSGIYFATGNLGNSADKVGELPYLRKIGSENDTSVTFNSTFTSDDLTGLDGRTDISFYSYLPGGPPPHTVSGTASYDLSDMQLNATLQLYIGRYDESAAEGFDVICQDLVDAWSA